MIKSVYLIQSLEEGYYKIGISIRPNKRIQQLQTGNSSELKLINTFSSEYANKIEKTLHNQFLHLRKEGEWFELSLIEALDFTEKCEKIEKNIIFLKKSGNVFI